MDGVVTGVRGVEGRHVSNHTEEAVVKKTGIKLCHTQHATKQSKSGMIRGVGWKVGQGPHLVLVFQPRLCFLINWGKFLFRRRSNPVPSIASQLARIGNAIRYGSQEPDQVY